MDVHVLWHHRFAFQSHSLWQKACKLFSVHVTNKASESRERSADRKQVKGEKGWYIVINGSCWASTKTCWNSQHVKPQGQQDALTVKLHLFMQLQRMEATTAISFSAVFHVYWQHNIWPWTNCLHLFTLSEYGTMKTWERSLSFFTLASYPDLFRTDSTHVFLQYQRCSWAISLSFPRWLVNYSSKHDWPVDWITRSIDHWARKKDSR